MGTGGRRSLGNGTRRMGEWRELLGCVPVCACVCGDDVDAHAGTQCLFMCFAAKRTPFASFALLPFVSNGTERFHLTRWRSVPQGPHSPSSGSSDAARRESVGRESGVCPS